MKKELTVEEILEMMDYDFEHFHHNESSVLAYDKLRQQQDEIEALKAKTLTDEEIHYAVKRWEMHYNYKHNADVHESLHEFARAILRKVQEK